MRYTFVININYDEPGHESSGYEITENLNNDEEERLIASYKSGKYQNISEDRSIEDIYCRVYDMGEELAAYAGEYNPVFCDYMIDECIAYPKELIKEDKEDEQRNGR